MQREECPAAGTNAPGIVIVNCEVVVSCKCPPTQKRPRPTHHIHAAAFQCGTGTTVRSGTPLLLPLLRNCYGCTRRIGAYECSVVDHGLVNHGTIVCEYPLIAPVTVAKEGEEQGCTTDAFLLLTLVAKEGEEKRDHVARVVSPGSDQKCGWFVATYAILRIRFALLTHVPRALRLKLRGWPQKPSDINDHMYFALPHPSPSP
eukprot:1195588-Prorocentrum_minimum.AAC.9